MSELRGGILVLVEVRGHQVLRRLPQSAEGLADWYAAGLSLQSGMGQNCRVIGAFVGIIRKHGFGRTGEKTLATGSLNQGNATERTAAKLDVLLSKFGMLESTLAVTRNPRLQRSLPAEADRGRR